MTQLLRVENCEIAKRVGSDYGVGSPRVFIFFLERVFRNVKLYMDCFVEYSYIAKSYAIKSNHVLVESFDIFDNFD